MKARTWIVLIALLFCVSMAHSMTQLKPRQLSAHFNEQEFACHHCGKVKVDIELLRRLEELRAVAGNRTVKVVSGYRCPKHNNDVCGVPNSQHLYGKAADIKISLISPQEVAELARLVGFSTVIQYKTFVHVDVR